MNSMHELHAHLYGCLDTGDLRWLATRKEPRWEQYRRNYFQVHGVQPELTSLFEDTPESRARLEANYYYKKVQTFAHFQICFDLVIAISDTSPEEMHEIYRRVFAREQAKYAEYRQMFAPGLSDEKFMEKVRGVAEAAAAADDENPGRETRVAISLFRPDEHARKQYRLVRRVMVESEIAARYITGLDFCAQEEGHPPTRKVDLFRDIHEDNEKEPEKALAILYHVGESYTDKSAESAVRWVLQAARLGAHRLGHAVALGVVPEYHGDTVRREIISERRDQIDFELEHLDELTAAGCSLDGDALRKEKQELSEAAPDDFVEIHYDPGRVENLRAFQDWAMSRVRETGAIIESCPTSNLRICGLGRPEYHPLPRFLEAGLNVVIGADDPGILDTSLEQEFKIISEWQDITSEHISRMQETAIRSRSELLTGRESQG